MWGLSIDEVRDRYEIPLGRDHDDFEMVEPIVSIMLRNAGGWEKFAKGFSLLVRQAVDEVIDTARTNRFTLSDTEKTEKTYLGTKIEILFRALLGLEKGRVLDLSVDGVEVDIKNTMLSNWEIPTEAIPHPCVLIQENERTAKCGVGVIIAHEKYLRPGANRDRKRSISAAGKLHIWWILREFPYPQNIWESMPIDVRETIMLAPGGSKRVAALFEAVQGKPLGRSIVEHVAQQKDALKRVRRNGGARDHLSPKGIAILFGQNDRYLIDALHLPAVNDDEFISYEPVDEFEKSLLRREGHID